MIQKLRERSGSESGFTLVELLVVMLILGLLAAIAIPAFFNQRDKAKDADAKESVRTAQTAIETYSTDNDGSYLNADEDALIAIEPTLADAPGGTLAVSNLADNTFTVAVTSNTGTEFSITRNSNGTTDLLCDAPEVAGCPTGGDWGSD
jgi:type IV pilus assembly protein PilA